MLLEVGSLPHIVYFTFVLKVNKAQSTPSQAVEQVTRLELAAFCVEGRHSTIELHLHFRKISFRISPCVVPF